MYYVAGRLGKGSGPDARSAAGKFRQAWEGGSAVKVNQLSELFMVCSLNFPESSRSMFAEGGEMLFIAYFLLLLACFEW